MRRCCTIVFSIWLLNCLTTVWADENLPRFNRISTHKQYTINQLVLKSPVTSVFPRNDYIYADVFLPVERANRMPVVIVLPGLAEPTKWVEYQFCKALVKNNIAAVLIELP